MSEEERHGCGAVWIAVIIGLMAVSTLPGSSSAGSQPNPCPLVLAGTTLGDRSAGHLASVPVPGPLNPCPGWEWAKSYGTPGVHDAVSSVDVTADGGAVLAVGTAGGGGVTLIKVDTNGTVQWQKNYRSGAGQIRQTSDGGYILALSGVWITVLRLDPLGAILWQHRFDGPGNDIVWSIEQTGDGGYILAGDTDPETDVWVLRLDPNGGVVWQKTFGGPNPDSLGGVQPTPDGGFVVGGTVQAGWPQGTAAWVLKLDSAGTIVWQRNYGAKVASLMSIRVALDGGFAFTGSVNGKLAVVKLTATGAISWQQTYGVIERIDGSIWPTADGGYAVSKSVAPSSGGGYWDFMVLRIDASGNRLWQKTYGGPLSEQVCFPGCIQEASDGNFLVAGSTNSFGTGGGTGSNVTDAWVLRIFSNGAISSTCDPSFGTGTRSPTVARAKLSVGSPSFVASTWSATITDPGLTGSDGSLIPMTQCSA